VPAATDKPRSYRAAETALLFPTGGYHWAGMGSDIEGSVHAPLLERAEVALVESGVGEGALRRLMAGEDQVRRLQADGGWRWAGDFPLSVAAQTLVSVVLAREFEQVHGTPALVAGESMGEIAAYCVTGALPIEWAVLLAYHWAQALQRASDRLGLRMAVIEDLRPAPLAELSAKLAAQVVVSEAPSLVVVALPASRLGELEREVDARGGRVLVSSNPCAAHEPRLAAEREIWAAHERWLRELPLTPPVVPLLSTLEPGLRLDTSAALLQNRVATTFTPVRWGETVRTLPGHGVRNLLLLGAVAGAYALRKLRGEALELRQLRIDSLGTLEGVDALPRRLRTPVQLGTATA
jgi:acyl transferase domain-containing protein